jgi:8-oxo-dGTP pyrophosphatase MutT (NUDIX family)
MSAADRPAPDTDGATPAATVLIVRDRPCGLEVLAIERARGMGFAGGAVAFPGGKLDPGDSVAGPAIEGAESLLADDAAARVCAAREAFEETALLLSAGPPVPADARSPLRRASDRHEVGFADLLAGIGHRLDLAVLKPFARWLPPPGLHRRFDTRFYLAALPAGQEMEADGHEAVTARWAAPAALLAEADAGGIGLLFPTRCNLARLAAFADVDTLLADPTPAPFIQPTVGDDGWLTIPENIGYPYTRERLERVRRS